ncbi:thiamine biosynthesis protein ThiS [Azospirillum sp. TSH7]|uniref:sulfur carrier protein ThiS n=1 Tax=unclassified Azospirillum TaxID=2630922 RepID=UPI000D604FEF|nr:MULTISPECIES: sulfur carrier protein ThiS [unclassified Azospirillum]PWC57543.1 thiamine biosynthesis protein ThiS [Azospirillum sp. TSH20]PWC59009.1 thiamine biosynthesis protein ThiS [Azospirillum sp. TSH7]
MSAIRINGREEPLSAASLAELLAGRGIAEGAQGVAVALNGAVVPRRRWPETRLQPGDSLEIVRPIQGG